MRVRKDKYLLTEIANEFAQSKIGNELTLLECLREGQLKACIMFPPYNPKPTEIPKEQWELLASEFFRVSNFRSELSDDDNLSQQEEYSIDADFLNESESEKLATVADAIASRDTSLIHEEYRTLLIRDKINLKKPSVDDWREIAHSYAGCCNALDMADYNQHYAVYVLREDWRHFVENYVEATNPLTDVVSKSSAGRQKNKHWAEIYEYICACLIKEGSSVMKNRNTFAEKIEKWAGLKFGANDAPKQDTIYRVLQEIYKKSNY